MHQTGTGMDFAEGVCMGEYRTQTSHLWKYTDEKLMCDVSYNEPSRYCHYMKAFGQIEVSVLLT